MSEWKLIDADAKTGHEVLLGFSGSGDMDFYRWNPDLADGQDPEIYCWADRTSDPPGFHAGFFFEETMSDTHQAEQTDQTQFEDDSTPEEMTEAQGLGWKSPADWKGEPPKNGFKKAKDFLEHGRTVLPIVRSENAALKRELGDAR